MNREKINLAIVYFSKDRPLQLDLAIRSNVHYSYGDAETVGTQVVLYKSSSARVEKAYVKLSKEHPRVVFKKETDFQKDILSILEGKEYVFFITDDTVFVRGFRIADALLLLREVPSFFGVSLRLGINTKICYPLEIQNTMPTFFGTTCYDMLYYNWWDEESESRGDFYYPLEVSSSIYRVSDICESLKDFEYSNPNEMESAMDYSRLSFAEKRPQIVCYVTSKAFSIPLNKVNSENNNRSGHHTEFSVESLLAKFEDGYRAELYYFDNMVSVGCHQEVYLSLKEANDDI